MESEESQMKFVSIVKDYPVLLDASTVAGVKRRRANAVAEVKRRLLDSLGVEMKAGQIWNRLQTMKSRIQKKTEKGTAKGSKLKAWEEDFLSFLESSPATPKKKGADVSLRSTCDSDDGGGDDYSMSCDETTFASPEPKPVPFASPPSATATPRPFPFASPLSAASRPVRAETPRRTSLRESAEETDETRELSTEELQRLVLLEQLRLYRLKREHLERKMAEERRAGWGAAFHDSPLRRF